VVTGGSRGIGLAIGRWFLAHGYRVALIDRDAATLDASVAALVNRAGVAVFKPVLETSFAEWREVMATRRGVSQPPFHVIPSPRTACRPGTARASTPPAVASFAQNSPRRCCGGACPNTPATTERWCGYR